MPTKFGQRFKVKQIKGSDLVWESYTPDGEKWFSAQLSLLDFSSIKTTDQDISDELQKLLKNAVRLNSDFLSKWNGFKIICELEFDRDWGLGSSSTLTYMVAQWAEVNPLLLHFKVSEGSGYDVACAGADGPLEYQVTEDEVNYREVNFKPGFSKNLYFIYLGEKASSKIAVRDYLKNVKGRKSLVKSLDGITEEILKCKSLTKFCDLLESHEEILSNALGEEKIKAKLFSDFWGCVKSLGAWGGDFALVVSSKSTEETKKYFSSKGITTFFPYDDFILNGQNQE